MKTNFLFQIVRALGCAAIVLTATRAVALATDYDAVADFSATLNDASQTWQYGSSETDGTGFSNMELEESDASVDVWHRAGHASGDMGIVRNKTGADYHYNIFTVQAADELGLFPGNDGRKAIVRWKAPASGIYQVAGQFKGIDQTSSDGSIVFNGNAAAPLFSAFVDGQNTVKAFALTVSVHAGDTLDFRVGWGSNSSYSFDGTGLKAAITPALSGSVTINFDNFAVGQQPADFLAAYGIPSITYGGASGSRGPAIGSENDPGNNSVPASHPNLFYQYATAVDAFQDHILTFTFDPPLTAFALSRVGKVGGGSTDTWHADFYDADDNLIGSFGESSPIIEAPVTPFSFTAPENKTIAKMNLVSNWTAFATNATIPVDDFVLTQGAPAVGAPTVTTTDATDLTITTAKLHATVNPNGLATEVTFYVDNSSRGTVNVPAGSTDVDVTLDATGFTPGTMHNVYAYASNSQGSASGDYVNFTLLGGVPSVTTLDPLPLGTFTATLRATVNPNLVDTTVTFYYDSSSVGSVDVPAGSEDVEVSVNLINQTPGSTHSYYAYASSAGGTASGSSVFFTFLGGAPVVTTLDPLPLTTSTAKLRATINPNLVDTDVTFYYDSSSAGTVSVPAGTSDVEVSVDVMNQIPGSTHNYYAYATNTGGSTSGDYVFFTFLGGAPVVTTLDPLPLTTSTARLRATINPNQVATDVTFYYDSSSAGTVSVPAGTSDVEVSVDVMNQIPGSTHNYYAYATNAGGGTSGDYVFFTFLGGPPEVTTLAPQSIGATTATLRATVNPNHVETTVSFYVNSSFQGSVVMPAGATPVTATLPVSGLSPSTSYSVYADATNAGGYDYGDNVSFTTLTPSPEAETNVVLLRGDLTPSQPPDALFSLLRPASINAAGHLALKGNVFVREATEADPNPITTANDMMIWADKGLAPLTLVAREGDVAPDSSGGLFASFSDPVQSDNDAVTFKASLKLTPKDAARDDAIYTDLGGVLTKVVRESDTIAGVGSAQYKTFTSVAVVNQGLFGVAALKSGTSEVISGGNDVVLWSWAPGDTQPHIRLREGDSLTLAAGVSRIVKTFDVLTAKAGVTGQARTFTTAPSVLLRAACTDGSVAFVKLTSSAAFLDTREVVNTIIVSKPATLSPVPTAPVGANFASIDSPAVNVSGHRAFKGTVAMRKTVTAPAPLPAITAANNAMIWADQGATPLSVIARKGDPAPGTNGTFGSFMDPIIDANDHVAFLGALNSSVPLGIVSTNNQGLWAQIDGGTVTLISREGSTLDGVPSAAVVNTITSVIVNDTGGAFAGKLRVGAGGVTANSDSFLAIWRVGDGAAKVVLREGMWIEVSAGHPRAVKSFDVFTPQAPFGGMSRSHNAAGQIAVYCVFVDGTTGVFTFEPASWWGYRWGGRDRRNLGRPPNLPVPPVLLFSCRGP